MKFEITLAERDSVLNDMSLDGLAELGYASQTRVAEGKLMLGAVLLEARTRFIADKEFGDWRRGNFPHLKKEQTTELMNLAKFFNKDRPMEGIGLSIGYELSAPKNAGFADKAYEDLKGKNLKGKEAKEIIEAHRPAEYKKVIEPEPVIEKPLEGDDEIEGEVLPAPVNFDGGKTPSSEELFGKPEPEPEAKSSPTSTGIFDADADAEPEDADDSFTKELIIRNETKIAESKLPPQLENTSHVLNQNHGQYLSTFQLRDHGIASASQCIARLAAKGAVIDTVRKNAIDSSGIEHERVAHYKLRGWA